jgi:uncharacterized membrane protein
MWINHHRLFQLIERTDHALLVLNGLLLLGICFVPFPTAIIAEFIKHRDSSVAALILGGTYTLLAVFFNAIWWHESYRRRLLRRTVGEATIKSINRSYGLGTPLYLLSMLLTLISAPASLGMNLLLAVFYALPSRLLPRPFR